MTPEERAVIEAARAFVAELTSNEGRYREYFASAKALESAVRALPRPLAERLAELRPGDVVEFPPGDRLTVAFNHPQSGQVVLQANSGMLSVWIYRILERDRVRIISNPEPGRG